MNVAVDSSDVNVTAALRRWADSLQHVMAQILESMAALVMTLQGSSIAPSDATVSAELTVDSVPPLMPAPRDTPAGRYSLGRR